MSSDSKPFPPSDLKLERLREQGVLPFSKDLLAIGVILGMIIGTWLLRSKLGPAFLNFTEELYSAPLVQYGSGEAETAVQRSAQLQTAFDHGMVLLLSFAVPVLSLVILFGFLQTKFLISVSALKPSLARLFSLEGFSIRVLGGQFFEGVVQCAKTAAWVIVSLLLLRYVFRSAELWLGSRESGSERLADALREGAVEAANLLQVQLLVALCFAFFLGLASYFVRYLQFHRLHRMSRAEVEEEYREMEAAPELRTAQRDFHEDGVE